MTPEYIVMGIGLLLAAWYFMASMYNRRFGLRTYRWLQRGLAALGDTGSVRAGWIGSSGSGARIGLTHAHPPFARLELIYLLESRELAPLWLVERLRGKRDQLILRATLSRPRPGELEVMPAGDGLAKSLRQETARPWTIAEGPHGLLVGRRGRAAPEGLAAFLDKYGPRLKRLSWGPQEPHLLIVLRLAGLAEGEAAGLFQDFRRLAGE